MSKPALNKPKYDLAALVRWGLLLVILMSGFVSVQSGVVAFLLYLLPMIFVFMHGSRYLGKREIIVFFVLIFIVTFTAEYLGVHTGQIFGNYFYNTQNNGPVIGGVPPLVMLTYFSLGYGVYLVSRILLGDYGVIKGAKILAISAIGGMLMTLSDLASDPVNSTINHVYTWVNGGPFFGVPYLNFVGWFFETAIFFGLVSLVLGYWLKAPRSKTKLSKSFLFEAVILFAAPILPIILRPLWETSYANIYQAMSLIALFGLGGVVLVASCRLAFAKKISGRS